MWLSLKSKTKAVLCEPGIVYVFSQKEAESVASELQDRDIVAYPYHATMAPDDKSRVHHRWMSNRIQVCGIYAWRFGLSATCKQKLCVSPGRGCHRGFWHGHRQA